MRRPVGTRDRVSEDKVRDAHHHQRSESYPGIWQFLSFEWFRFVMKISPIALPARLRGTQPTPDVCKPYKQNEHPSK